MLVRSRGIVDAVWPPSGPSTPTSKHKVIDCVNHSQANGSTSLGSQLVTVTVAVRMGMKFARRVRVAMGMDEVRALGAAHDRSRSLTARPLRQCVHPETHAGVRYVFDQIEIVSPP